MADTLRLNKPTHSERVHLVVGGHPAGEHVGHDLDYVRLRLLSLLAGFPALRASVSGDYADLETYLPPSRLLITYTAGPYPEEPAHRSLRQWLTDGGRHLALHGSSASWRTERDPDHPGVRRMMKVAFHDTLGCRFVGHPPLRRYRVDVIDPGHPLARGLPMAFEVEDEPYYNTPEGGEERHYFLTTEMPEDPTPEAWRAHLPPSLHGAAHKSALLADGRSLPVAYTKRVGRGAVAYIALGHAHSSCTNLQPGVDESIAPNGESPPLFRGPWETEAYQTLLRNGVAWGLGAATEGEEATETRSGAARA